MYVYQKNIFVLYEVTYFLPLLYIIGVIGKWNSVKYGFGASLKRGGEAFIDMAFLVFKGFKMVATNEILYLSGLRW